MALEAEEVILSGFSGTTSGSLGIVGIVNRHTSRSYTHRKIDMNDKKIYLSDETILAIEICSKDAERKVTALAAKLIEVMRSPNIEHVADEHNAAVRALRNFKLGE
jgi:hypothetical protein